jgi:CheY-like chemotaxis protein
MARILVIEDEPLSRDLIKSMRALDGHEVETTSSGEAALVLFDKGKFDLVLADYELPLMNGGQLAAAIKARAPNLPVALVTGYAQQLQAEGVPFPGVDLIISKPFDLQELREAFYKLLRK